jgi:nucleoside-diphosphate-sugar epimerase
VHRGDPVDVTMGHVNVIWQGDANALALRCLAHTTSPTSPLNVTGPHILSVRWLAEEFARRFGRTAKLSGREAPSGWLNNAARMVREFGPPKVGIERMLDWTADWLLAGMPSHGKPTHYEVRDGRF